MSAFDQYRCPCSKKVVTTNYCPHCGAATPKPPRRFRYEGMRSDPAGSHAIKTSEFRPPKRGEWFLSGAVPMAYRAPNDLSHPYRIMQVIKP